METETETVQVEKEEKQVVEKPEDIYDLTKIQKLVIERAKKRTSFARMSRSEEAEKKKAIAPILRGTLDLDRMRELYTRRTKDDEALLELFLMTRDIADQMYDEQIGKNPEFTKQLGNAIDVTEKELPIAEIDYIGRNNGINSHIQINKFMKELGLRKRKIMKDFIAYIGQGTSVVKSRKHLGIEEGPLEEKVFSWETGRD